MIAIVLPSQRLHGKADLFAQTWAINAFFNVLLENTKYCKSLKPSPCFDIHKLLQSKEVYEVLADAASFINHSAFQEERKLHEILEIVKEGTKDEWSYHEDGNSRVC